MQIYKSTPIQQGTEFCANTFRPVLKIQAKIHSNVLTIGIMSLVPDTKSGQRNTYMTTQTVHVLYYLLTQSKVFLFLFNLQEKPN